jgi:hypothetical protein
MTCDQARPVIGVWNPQHDLPDDVVDHLERCPLCMQVFEARFPPLVVASTPADEARPARRSLGVWGLAAAAMLALAPLGALPSLPSLSAGPSTELARMTAPPGECPLPEDLPAECPPA